MPMPGGIDQRLGARMGGGLPPQPGRPPPQMPGLPPQAGPGPMQGGGVGGQLQQLLAEAIILTKQAGPEAWIQEGLGDLWKGAFAVLDKGIAPARQQLMQQGGVGAQPGPPTAGLPMGAGAAPPMPMR